MTLNEAILNVLLNQFKKEMNKQAIEMVEQAGYKIIKIQGGYEVKNPNTGRWVSIERGNYSRYIYNNVKTVTVWREDPIRFDFANYLNKELNLAWAELNWNKCDWDTPTYKRMTALKGAKRSIRYAKESIEETKKKIANLQAELERAIRYEIETEQRLEKVRKELGLAK